MGKLLIVEMGQPIEVDVVRYYKKDNVNYFMYTKNEVDEQGYVKLYAAKINEEDGNYTTTDITNPMEWNDVKTTMKQIVRDNRELSPISVEDLNYEVLVNLNLTERHVFKLAENIKDYLSANKKEFKPAEEKSFSLENLIEVAPSVEPKLDETVVATSLNPDQYFNFDFMNEAPAMEEVVPTSVAAETSSIEELDLSGIHFDGEETAFEPMPEPFTLPEEELKDVTLMDVKPEVEEATDDDDTSASTTTWSNFEMPVEPVSEPITEEKEEKKHSGLFGFFKHKEEPEEEVSNKAEAQKMFTSLDRNEVELSDEETVKNEKVVVPLPNPEKYFNFDAANEEETSVETQATDAVLPEIEETEETPLEPMQVDMGKETPEVEASTTFEFAGFDSLNEEPSYELPSLESLGLNEDSKLEPVVEIPPLANDFEVLYNQEKQHVEELEKEMEALRQKLDEVKKIIG